MGLKSFLTGLVGFLALVAVVFMIGMGLFLSRYKAEALIAIGVVFILVLLLDDIADRLVAAIKDLKSNPPDKAH